MAAAEASLLPNSLNQKSSPCTRLLCRDSRPSFDCFFYLRLNLWRRGCFESVVAYALSPQMDEAEEEEAIIVAVFRGLDVEDATPPILFVLSCRQSKMSGLFTPSASILLKPFTTNRSPPRQRKLTKLPHRWTIEA